MNAAPSSSDQVPSSTPPAAAPRKETNRVRWRLLHELSRLLDKPMTVLAFVWLGLLVIDLVEGLPGPLEVINYVIWVLFGLHFLLEFIIAPSKVLYLRRNWLTAIALVLPALRLFRLVRALRAFRVLRATRAVRSVGLLRLITSLSRGMKATRRALGRRGVGYVMVTTAIVTFAGAAGMYTFENPSALREAGYAQEAAAGKSLPSYAEALWWTAMIMTTMGSEHWPKTPEGRILAFLLAVYAFAIFGYITATIASLFIGSDQSAEHHQAQAAGKESVQDIERLRAEIGELREQIEVLVERLRRHPGPEL